MKNFTQFLIKAVAMVVLLLLFSYVRAWVKQPAESARHESFRSDIERTMHESDTQFGMQWTQQQLGDLAFEAPMTLDLRVHHHGLRAVNMARADANPILPPSVQS